MRGFVYVVHFKLSVIYGQPGANDNRVSERNRFRLRQLRLRCGKPCCILCDLLHKAAFLLRGIMPVVEQAESTAHIFGKLLLCAADGIIGTVTLVRPIQP